MVFYSYGFCKKTLLYAETLTELAADKKHLGVDIGFTSIRGTFSSLHTVGSKFNAPSPHSLYCTRWWAQRLR